MQRDDRGAQAGSTSIVEGEKEAWWLDDRTKRLIEETMHLSGALTFTVRPGTPLQLTREQVCLTAAAPGSDPVAASGLQAGARCTSCGTVMCSDGGKLMSDFCKVASFSASTIATPPRHAQSWILTLKP